MTKQLHDEAIGVLESLGFEVADPDSHYDGYFIRLNIKGKNDLSAKVTENEYSFLIYNEDCGVEEDCDCLTIHEFKNPANHHKIIEAVKILEKWGR